MKKRRFDDFLFGSSEAAKVVRWEVNNSQSVGTSGGDNTPHRSHTIPSVVNTESPVLNFPLFRNIRVVLFLVCIPTFIVHKYFYERKSTGF